MDTHKGGGYISKARAWRPSQRQRPEGDTGLTVCWVQSMASTGAAIGSQTPHPAQPSSFLRKTIRAKQGRGELLSTERGVGLGHLGLQYCFEKVLPAQRSSQNHYSLRPPPRSLSHTAAPDRSLLPVPTAPSSTLQHPSASQ